jgi:hypothetical protein
VAFDKSPGRLHWAHRGAGNTCFSSITRFKTVTPSQCPSLLRCDTFESVTWSFGVTVCKVSQCPSLLGCDGVTLWLAKLAR